MYCLVIYCLVIPCVVIHYAVIQGVSRSELKNKKPVTGGAFHGFACNRLVLRFLIGSKLVVTLVAAGLVTVLSRQAG